VAQLLISNVVVTREILRRRTRLAPGVLAHRLAHPSDEVVTIMTSVISLSPGTMTADVDPDGTTLYVHFLLLHDIESARAGLARLESLVIAALGALRPGPPADVTP
jgi:multisubunit Na+/H+ antiporter MnhE subunit